MSEKTLEERVAACERRLDNDKSQWAEAEKSIVAARSVRNVEVSSMLGIQDDSNGFEAPRLCALDRVFMTPVHVQVFVKDGKFNGYNIANVSFKQA